MSGFALRIVAGAAVRSASILSEPLPAFSSGKSTGDASGFALAAGDAAVLTWASGPPGIIEFDVDGFRFGVDPTTVLDGWPIHVARVDLHVLGSSDERGLDALRLASAPRGETALRTIAAEPEWSFATAEARTRDLPGPTWLGIARDVRGFQCGFRGVGSSTMTELQWDYIAPQTHGDPVRLAQAGDRPVRYQYFIGRGLGPRASLTRSLDDGALPILHATTTDGPIRYDATILASVESGNLADGGHAGTHHLIADAHSIGHMLTDDEKMRAARLEAELEGGTTAAFLRIRATNTDAVPRYAFVKLPAPFVGDEQAPLAHRYDPATGIATFGEGGACFTARLDGRPVPATDCAVLVAPGETATFDIRIPHRPLDDDRVRALGALDFDAVLAGCRAFWRSRLDSAGRIVVPEDRIGRMFSAGVLHLDLVAYGREPDGTIAATVGVYTPIGSESSPIIQLFDSIGRHDLAARSLRYFAERQHENGFMQNFNGYMLETEAVLATMGDHFRYTADTAWLDAVEPVVRRAAAYILDNRSVRRSDATSEFGLIRGKTADDEDDFESFMLNGLAHLALSRAAEMIDARDPQAASSWKSEAARLRADLLAAYDVATGRSPVVPLGDGSWARTAPPWTGRSGPLALYPGDAETFSHGTFSPRDTLLGPLWLVPTEVMAPDDPRTDEILDVQADLFFDDNTPFSQPYYSPHPIVHLRRREVKAFLRAYYTMVASHADRETYSFWEHYYHLTPHKTHEEAQFLLQTRSMLYLEDAGRLRLLAGAPRAWFEPGSRVGVERMRSHFGQLDFLVEVDETGDRMRANIALHEPHVLPSAVELRLPHPSGRPISRASAGEIVGDELLVLPAGPAPTEIEVDF